MSRPPVRGATRWHVEPGETAEQAAVRELAEETTLRARVDRLLWTGRHNGRPAAYHLMAEVAGIAELSGPEAAEHGPDNSFELLWVGPERFTALNLHPADIRSPLADLLARGSRRRATPPAAVVRSRPAGWPGAGPARARRTRRRW